MKDSHYGGPFFLFSGNPKTPTWCQSSRKACGAGKICASTGLTFNILLDFLSQISYLYDTETKTKRS
jgi:hypothetical protein